MASVTAEGGLNVREITKLFYERALNYCKTPENRVSGKQAFVQALHRHIDELIEEQNYERVFECFEEAQSTFEDDADVLNVLAVALNRLEKPVEALNYLNKALEQCPKKVKLIENRENIINQWVPRWHFAMLNDQNRNLMYKNAINEKIADGFKNVLDIGTGTGLLSIYCHEAGAEDICACEVDEIMHKIADSVFKENNIPVRLFQEHSTKLEVSNFDLIVTEIFDCGAFGEGALASLIHAKKHLLKEGGRILPEKIKMYVVGVDKIKVREKHEALERAMENSIYLKNTILRPKCDGPYEPIEQVCSEMVLITDPVHAFTVNFNNLNSMEMAMAGDLDTKVKLSCLEGGVNLEGFLVYFELHLNEKYILKNFDPYDLSGKGTRCWDPVIFPLNHHMPVRKYQVLSASLSCKDGVLKLTHEYDNTVMRNLRIDPHIFSFLTDEKFIYELEFNVERVHQRNKKSFELLADFLPFPHIGINFLKENKIRKLYCLGELRELVKTIADWNLIPESSIEFVDDFESLAASGLKFDLIIMYPLNSYGTLNADQLKYYELLKTHCLMPIGTIFPFQMFLNCQLFHSSWLDRVTQVKNDELARLGIEQRINEYSTRHQFDFLNYDTNEISDVFRMTTLQFHDTSRHEEEITVDLNSSQPVMNGILYYYKIFFTKGVPIATNHNKFCRVNSFVQTVNVEGKSSLVVKFIQDELTFRIFVQSS